MSYTQRWARDGTGTRIEIEARDAGTLASRRPEFLFAQNLQLSKRQLFSNIKGKQELFSDNPCLYIYTVITFILIFVSIKKY